MSEAAAAAGYTDTGAPAGEPGFSGPAGDAMSAAAAAAGYSDTGAPEAGAPAADAEADPEADLPAVNAEPVGPLTSAVLANTIGLTPEEAQQIAGILQDAANRGETLSLNQAAQLAGVMTGAQQDSPYGGFSPGGLFGATAPGAVSSGAFGLGGIQSTGNVSGQGIGQLGDTGAVGFGLGGVQGLGGQLGDLGGVQSGLGQTGSSLGSANQSGDLTGQTFSDTLTEEDRTANPEDRSYVSALIESILDQAARAEARADEFSRTTAYEDAILDQALNRGAPTQTAEQVESYLSQTPLTHSNCRISIRTLRTSALRVRRARPKRARPKRARPRQVLATI
jgi:hypothetical protein